MSSEEPPRDRLVPIRWCATVFEARARAAALEAQGVRAYVFESERRGFGLATEERTDEPVPVYVRPEDVERAKALSDTERDADTGPDDSSVELEVPAQRARWWRSRRLLLIMLAALIAALLLGWLARLLTPGDSQVSVDYPAPSYALHLSG